MSGGQKLWAGTKELCAISFEASNAQSLQEVETAISKSLQRLPYTEGEKRAHALLKAARVRPELRTDVNRHIDATNIDTIILRHHLQDPLAPNMLAESSLTLRQEDKRIEQARARQISPLEAQIEIKWRDFIDKISKLAPHRKR